MKLHEILKSFAGSQTGSDECRFEAGTTAALSDSLAAIVVPEGWAKPAVTGLPIGDKPVRAEAIEAKVTGPEETKPAKPLNKMSKAELVAHGLSIGLELTPDNMTVKEMITAIESHATAESTPAE